MAGQQQPAVGVVRRLSFDHPTASPSIACRYEPRHYLAHLLPSGDLGRFYGSDDPLGVIT
jgi:hypothetical protein